MRILGAIGRVKQSLNGTLKNKRLPACHAIRQVNLAIRQVNLAIRQVNRQAGFTSFAMTHEKGKESQ
ncbi:MAG TPA: hypothetical protein VK982_04550 [Bacteroidales bacterium]|nr:hypothetical protein [Bacteroidales bacterium]